MNHMLPRPGFWDEAAQQLKTRRSLFGEMLRFLLLSYLGLFAQSILISIPVSGWLLRSKANELMEAYTVGELPQNMIFELMNQLPDWMTVFSLLSGGAIGLIAIFYCRKFQRRSLSSMGLCGERKLLESAKGLFLGLLLMAAVMMLGTVLGGFQLYLIPPSRRTVILLLLCLLGCFVYGASLELMIRGYYAPTIGAWLPVAPVLLMSTVSAMMVQTVDSMASLALANQLLLELILGIWVLKRGNLWGACALRAAWIFGERFLFAVAPAGQHSTISLVTVNADFYRPLLSGGRFGVMNSLCATVVLLIALTGVLALHGRDPMPVPSQTQEKDQ